MGFSVAHSEDPQTFTKPELARVINIHLELIVDFDQKVLKGKAILVIERKSPTNEIIILDNLGLTISRVTNIDGTRLDYNVILDHALLYVQLPSNPDPTYNSICKIQIEYETSLNSPVLYWLTPKQTADGKHPFLLSNNKLTYARAWFPCQDTPSVKFSYTAKISVQKHFRVLMSALLQEKSEGPELDVYEFRQKIPVPSYAVIIVVGSLEKRELHAKINIFAENRFIDESFDTFRRSGIINKIKRMLRIAESMCGPYIWDRNDICVLPPSISHLEIECPCVTFISPTIYHENSSYIHVLVFASKISQSWAGNSVTCANYNNLWLNKSFSSFISKRIIQKLLIYEDVELYLQRSELRMLNNNHMQHQNAWWPKCLLPNVTNFFQPHKITKHVPYEWGCRLLYYLEYTLGGPLVFEPFLKSYFNEFAYKSISTKDLINYLYQYFPDKEKILEDVNWDGWFYGVIVFPVDVSGTTARETKLFKLAEEWAESNCKTYSIPSILTDVKYPYYKTMFLAYLHYFHKRLTTEKLRLISNHFNHVFEKNNDHIRFCWLELCIKVQWAGKVKSALNFAIQFCSSNYAVSMFRQLYEWTEMRPTAIETYISNKEKMFYKTTKELDVILHLNS